MQQQQPEGKPRVQEKEEAKGAGRAALGALTTAPLLVGDRLFCLVRFARGCDQCDGTVLKGAVDAVTLLSTIRPIDSCITQAGGLASLKGFTYFFSPEPDTEVLLDRLHWMLLSSLSGACVHACMYVCVSFGGEGQREGVHTHVCTYKWMRGCPTRPDSDDHTHMKLTSTQPTGPQQTNKRNRHNPPARRGAGGGGAVHDPGARAAHGGQGTCCLTKCMCCHGGAVSVCV